MASTRESFLHSLRNKSTGADGRHNDYQALAFVIYKIAYDFSRSHSTSLSGSLFNQISRLIFDQSSLSFSNRLRMKKMRAFNRSSIQSQVAELVESLDAEQDSPIERRLSLVYDNVTRLADTFFTILISSLQESLEKGDLDTIVRNISSSLPGLFLSIPFFTTLRHISQGRSLLRTLNERFAVTPKSIKRVIWFTDTINDLNGVSVTLKNLGWIAFRNEMELKIVAVTDDQDQHPSLPPNIMNLKSIYSFNLPHYEQYRMHIPSILNALESLYAYEPDEICISTPGPVGLLGLLAARLLNVKVTGIYHTDFTMQATHITDDDSITELLETYTRWFFSAMDEVRVPTFEYMNLLESRGFDRSKMKLFPRGIDAALFRPMPLKKDAFKNKYGIPGGLCLCFAGRVSKDKNLDFLAEVYTRLLETYPECNLVIAGDGPYLHAFREQMAVFDRVVFTGNIPREHLPELYNTADLFMFPSTTDTFGMVVLEAQACGIPAIVSDQGGPKEIVLHGQTGSVLPVNNPEDWVNEAKRYLSVIKNDPDEYTRLQEETRRCAVSQFYWENVLKTFLDNVDARAVIETSPRTVDDTAVMVTA
jgi:glycosyltransferase involved in cell wall biosynthesis